jgi:hypothetical protein
VRRLLLSLAGIALLATGAPRAAETPGPPPPLTNEDVVRMVVQGRPEAEILRVIAASPVDFDLDREMSRELRQAGVTERILKAMRERQAVAGVPPPARIEAPVPQAPPGHLVLSFAPLDEKDRQKEKKAASFQVVRRIPQWAIRNLGMEEKAEVEELALFVVCTTPEHVPDHWQDRTQIKEFTRHRMLLFRPGGRPAKQKRFELLSLDIPESLPVEAPAGVHRVAVGVAAKVGPDWRAVASDQRDGVPVASGEATRIAVKLKGRWVGSGMRGFKEDQGLIIEGVQGPGKAP